ncbi:MAG: YidE/YbjL duplication [Microbacterium sp.]|nr:YidE/YbjL duplication [Microbacterium sp.]
MTWVRDTIIEHPEIAVFLALGVGFFVGRFSYRGIGLGAVTGTLLAGVVIGAVLGDDLQVDPIVKQIFFLIFLFSLGYKLGPQFVAGLKGSGLPQAVFAVLLAVVGFGTTIVISSILGYNPGLAAGLAGGGLTQSSIIGVAQDSIAGLPVSDATAKAWSDLVPVAYAVTYIFGTVGAALYISLLAPRFLGIRDLPAAAHDLEQRLGVHDDNPDVTSAYQQVVRRAYRLTSAFTLAPGDVVVVAGHHAAIIEDDLAAFAVEIDDPTLLDVPIEELSVVVTNKAVVGRTVEELRHTERARQIFLKGISRGGHTIPFGPDTALHAGDELRVQGPLPLLEQGIRYVGFPERTDPKTDMVTVALGITVGAVIGVPSITVGAVPLSLTTSVGALIVGLVLGWRRSKSPTFGHVPPGAQWFFETVGLTLFVAVVGINAGPGFIDGLAQYGVQLLVAGVVVTLVPLVVMTFVGRFFFRKTDPVLVLGMLTGAQTTTAAVGSLQETAKSSVPLLGFTVPYAIGNIVLSIGGAVVVAITAQ